MERFLLLFAISALPVILICWFIYAKDKNKEPIKLLSSLFGKGIVSCFWVLLISELMKYIFPFFEKDVLEMTSLQVFIYSFIGVALVEEACKWYFVHKIGYNNRYFDEKYDIIVYAVFVSLGFAFFENLVYVFSNDSISVGISRALLAVPGHACDSIFMGYYLILAKQAHIANNKEIEKSNKIKSILVPTILHGIYDFCLFINKEEFIKIFFAFVVFLYIISIKTIKKLSRTNKNLYHRQLKREYQNRLMQYQTNVYNYQQSNEYQNNQFEYCTNCGTPLRGPFCTNCGKRK